MNNYQESASVYRNLSGLSVQQSYLFLQVSKKQVTYLILFNQSFILFHISLKATVFISSCHCYQLSTSEESLLKSTRVFQCQFIIEVTISQCRVTIVIIVEASLNIQVTQETITILGRKSLIDLSSQRYVYGSGISIATSPQMWSKVLFIRISYCPFWIRVEIRILSS